MKESLKSAFENIGKDTVVTGEGDHVKVKITNVLQTSEIIALGETVAKAEKHGFDATMRRSGIGITLDLLESEPEPVEA